MIDRSRSSINRLAHGGSSEGRPLQLCMELLPDDVLAAVLQRVAPRGLATSRCVCRAWRALIDGRRLLRSDLLPRSLAGLFLNYNELRSPDFFRRPGVDLGDRYRTPKPQVADHCNGVLLLASGWLLNPATGWRAPLPELFPAPPPRTAGMMRPYNVYDDVMHLVFDPAVSPHCCEVFLIPRASDLDSDSDTEEEWPPSPFRVHVFSTVTGRWTETVLTREGKATGTVAEMQCDDERASDYPRPAAYWRGALYVHCGKDFIMRVSLSDHKYRVIKPPCDINIDGWSIVRLERSEKGVYLASFDGVDVLRVWVLDESCGSMEWVLKHSSGVGFAQPHSPNYVDGPWTLENREKGDIYIDEPAEQEHKWDSDDEGVEPQDKGNQNLHRQLFGILGFHPYKEIIFLVDSLDRGLAYHLNSSKLEALGDIFPKYYYKWAMQPEIEACFPYTPCMMGQ